MKSAATMSPNRPGAELPALGLVALLVGLGSAPAGGIEDSILPRLAEVARAAPRPARQPDRGSSCGVW